MYYLYLISKGSKYLALSSLIITFFSDLLIFKLLCCFIFINIAFEISALKCSILQIIGIFKIKRRFKNDMPSPENYKSEVEYSLPFNGKWAAVNGSFRKEYSHSWDIPTQRYAYDFLILDESPKSHSGKHNECDGYYCYDEDILAPADGTIVEVVNNANDSLIFSRGKFFSRARHIAGNYIVIKHAQREFSTLAHLKKDSITVKVGDVVSRGQCIAKCGNTGNSSEPHLHFQLQTDQSFYNSAGLPIRFKNIDLSQIDNYEKYDPRPHMALEQVLNGYVTRGFAVENQTIKRGKA